MGPGLAATLGKPGGTEEDICFYGTVPVRPLPSLPVTSTGPHITIVCPAQKTPCAKASAVQGWRNRLHLTAATACLL